MRTEDAIALFAVFLFALAVRMVPVLRGGGIHFYGRYDDGVYYTAAEALTFGHVPYRDFVLLHPPGGALALTPFTLLGRLTSDPVGMTVARLSFMALGSSSAVLVALIAGRWGRIRGLMAGLIYAASAAAAYSEQTTFLEPLGTLLTLVALLALAHRGGRRGQRLETLAGVALGLACAVKIWYVAIFGGIVLVLLIGREIRAAVRTVSAGVGAAGALTVPLLLLAPHQMWTMVVQDQFGRSDSSKPPLDRISSIVGTKTVLDGGAPWLLNAATVCLVLLLLLAVAVCAVERQARMIVATFVVSSVVLLASPAYFRHYGVLVAAPSALVLAVGFGRLVDRLRRPWVRRAVPILAGAAVIASGIAVAVSPAGRTFPSGPLSAAAPTGCIGSDDPAAVIQMNRLTSDFRDGCDVPVDVTGASYGAKVQRGENTAFRTWLVDHLVSSDGFVVLRLRNDMLSEQEKSRLRTFPVLASANGVNLRHGRGH